LIVPTRMLALFVGGTYNVVQSGDGLWFHFIPVVRHLSRFPLVQSATGLPELMTSSPQQVTELLNSWSNGDQTARDRLIPLVYDELHRLAHQYMKREAPGHTLQTSALVNEAFVKLVDQRNVRWQNRAHFFGIAAQLMRRILVDHARSRQTAKRGGGAAAISFDDHLYVSDERSAQVVAVHEALEQLARFDQRKGQIVELRFFGGLSIDETAELLGVSPGTVMRDWTLAKAWLHREISAQVPED